MRIIKHAIFIVLYLTCLKGYGADPSLDMFKEFLSGTPAFHLIRYSVNEGCGPKENIYLLAVAGSDYALRHTKRERDFSIPISRTNNNISPLFIGRSSTMRWQISGYRLIQSFDPNMTAPDPYATASDSSLMIISEVLTFLSQQNQPGSFKWNGDEFESKLNPVAEQLLKGAGRDDPHFIKNITQGSVRRVAVNKLVLETPLAKSELTFTNDPAIPRGWPKTVDIIREGKCEKRITFHEVRPGKLEEVQREINPVSYITAEVMERSIWSNSVEIARSRPNELVVSLVRTELDGMLEKEGKTKKSKPLLFIGGGVVALLVIGWVATRK
ncbi:MAG: hypothetical protein SFY81_09970 [Verrucomicrobiota bacterium]|nr:hypothetical protein [Verrucomicrobiota bacterium]